MDSLRTTETLSWMQRVLPPPPARILEVGAGEGELAAALSRRGYVVRAIDLDAANVAAARAREVDADVADVTTLEARGFDAVLFTSSLHHVEPLEEGLLRARAALRPAGIVLCEEFALEEADDATARWLYERLDALERSGRLNPAHRHGHAPGHASARGDRHAEHRAPLAGRERWLDEHEGLHHARAVIAALEARFGDVRVETVPYLYRYVSARAVDPAIAEEALVSERAAIAAGSIRALGRRIVAR
jgi:SAM-dependent methyltransferase